jgi:hypothetical protein
MKRTVLLGAAALTLVALAVVFAPVALCQKKEAPADGIRVTKGEFARIFLKNGRDVVVSEPRTKLIAGQPFVGGKASPSFSSRISQHWVPVSEVAQIDDFANEMVLQLTIRDELEAHARLRR